MKVEINEDRRVRKTKKALREGLAQLLNEKNLQHITVRELTDNVDIHRSTFYANFSDIYDLYSHLEDTIVNEISDIVSVDLVFKPTIFYRCLLEYISNNRQISRLFFSGAINSAFFDRIADLCKEACMDCWRDEYDLKGNSEELEYYVQFCIMGALGVIGLWVSRDFDCPIEKLVDMLVRIDTTCGKLLEHSE